jgi:hypothetical protein
MEEAWKWNGHRNRMDTEIEWTQKWNEHRNGMDTPSIVKSLLRPPSVLCEAQYRWWTSIQAARSADWIEVYNN